MKPDDFPPPPAGLTRYVMEAGSFAEERWTPSGVSAVLDALNDQVAIECTPGMVRPAGMTPEAGTHLRIVEAATDRTVEWMVLFPHRDG